MNSFLLFYCIDVKIRDLNNSFSFGERYKPDLNGINLESVCCSYNIDVVHCLFPTLTCRTVGCLVKLSAMNSSGSSCSTRHCLYPVQTGQETIQTEHRIT